MINTKKFSRKQLFCIARAIAGISLKKFCKSISPKIESSMIHICLSGRWKNVKINAAIDRFIGINIAAIVDWSRSQEPEGQKKTNDIQTH